jgi:hypothetical protein
MGTTNVAIACVFSAVASVNDPLGDEVGRVFDQVSVVKKMLVDDDVTGPI